LFTYNAPTTTTTPSTSAPATTAPATAAPVGPVNVTSSNQSSLTQTPGAATAIVNGQPVTVAVETPADLPAAQVDPEDRSPAQVAALQTAADNLVSQLNQAAGGNSGLAVQDTPTGAAITGLLDKPVPVENTVLVEAGTKSTLFAALNQDGSVTEVQPGAVIEVLGDGQVGVVASGLTPGETAEFVIMSTPTLLGSYTVSANGTIKAQTSLPDGIGLGNHTLVVASPTVQASLGLKVSATPSTLPATGASSSNTMQIALFLMVGGSMVAFLRRRRHILN
jgi:LPXTG-motif cell wall-anchored protein